MGAIKKIKEALLHMKQAVDGFIRKYRKLFILSLIVGLSSLLYIDFYINNFKFTFAGVMLPLILYIYDESNPIVLGFTSGLSILLFRGFFYGISNGMWVQQFYYLMPEIMFYILYGFLFYILKETIEAITYRNIFAISFIIDIVSNILETSIRLQQNLFDIDFNITKTLLLIGLIRAGLVWLIVIGYEYYKLFLVKEEHEKRYRNLLQLTSQLKTETYWMEKNMDYIENVMSKAYKLFTNINEGENREKWGKEALAIATGIHEIKKEYKLVAVGLEEIMSTRLDNTGMYFHELISILKESLQREAKGKNKDIDIEYNVKEDFYTGSHYYLMSILRNVIMNAIDSIEGRGSIVVSHSISKDKHKFTIEDNGRGIGEDKLAKMFSPGYSTKIDYTTGEINRGLGLALVKSIVDVQLKGRVKVDSKLGVGTTFSIWIPIKELEGVDI